MTGGFFVSPFAYDEAMQKEKCSDVACDVPKTWQPHRLAAQTSPHPGDWNSLRSEKGIGEEVKKNHEATNPATFPSDGCL